MPRPFISVALTTSSVEDSGLLARVLSVLATQDPSLRVEESPIGDQFIVSGTNESQLEHICNQVSQQCNIEIGSPKVIYLEKIRKPAEAEGKYIRQVGGRGNYAHVKLRREPLEEGSGFQFSNEITNGSIPHEFIDPVRLGTQEAMKAGVLRGYEMTDLSAVLCGGSYHDEDSDANAFKIAASKAFTDAARKAHPVVLEPFMSAQVDTPVEFLTNVFADLDSRRGRITNVEPHERVLRVHADAPMAELFGYSANLSRITRGFAVHSSQFVRYEASPDQGESDEDTSGVTANKPNSPRKGQRSAAANPERD